MEAITYLVALSVSFGGGGGTGKSAAAAALVGTWKVQLSQEVRDVARKMGMAEPSAQLVFNSDNTFQYSSNGAGPNNSFKGTFDYHDHAVTLLAQNSVWPSSGLVAQLKDDKELSVDGLNYVKTGSGSGSCAGSSSFAGTYTLRTAHGEDVSTKLVFKTDGSFSFSGQFATSKGKFSVEGNLLKLVWEEIDNEKVAPGSVHKTITMNDDGSFQIDSFRYLKQ